jgi:FKBP-type peptidyl-prolyl cis-trans isomerase 2
VGRRGEERAGDPVKSAPRRCAPRRRASAAKRSARVELRDEIASVDIVAVHKIVARRAKAVSTALLFGCARHKIGCTARAALMPFQILSTLREGTGAPAKVGDKLVVHYKGTLADGGAVFDDSRERGHAFTFALGCNKVIRGWDEALVGATKGARFTVRIPSADAYGPKGAPPRIPPNADLVFDLELLNINETLVEEGMRFRQEEEARVQRFLAVQDEERRAEAAGGGGGGRKAAKRSRSDDGGSGSDSDSSSSSESSGARRRRKEKKRKKKERKKERRKEKKEKKEKKSKKSKKKRHKSQSES